MLNLERVADMFDEMHKDNLRTIESGFQDWVDDQYRSGSSWRFYGAATVAGVTEAIYTVAATFGQGLVDTLRVGESWDDPSLANIGKDGLRVISLVGGAFRVVRLLSAELQVGGRMSCTISSSAKAATLSGRWARPALVFDRMAQIFGGSAAAKAPTFRGTATPLELETFFRMTNTKIAKAAVSTLDDVAAVAKKGKGPVVFGVRWAGPAGMPGRGHTMVAYRDLLGRLRVADQLGRTVKFSEITTKIGPVAQVYPEVMTVHDAAMVLATRYGATGQFLAQQIDLLAPRGMKMLEDKVREKTGRAPPGSSGAPLPGPRSDDTGGSSGSGAAAGPPGGQIPVPNLLSPTLQADVERVLKAMPRAPATIEAASIQQATGLTAERIADAWYYLARSGLVHITAWSNRDGKTIPAMARRTR